LKSTRTSQCDFYYHIGVYFFRRAALKQFQKWEATPSEIAESLEQLRILENGKNIRVYLTKTKTVSVDAPGDLKKLKEVFN
jgi:CMP-2-keto-3-deoxyoctulosonic acid synthetase